MTRSGLLVAAVLAIAPMSVAAAPDDDWGVKRDPFDAKVIATYKGILGSNPHDAGALAKLLEMYRRYRTVDLLKSEYGKLLEKRPDDWAALTVLGHLYRKTGDDPRALEMWTRAVAKRDADAATWLAIGEVHKGGGNNKEARAAYEKALSHASAKDMNMKKQALRALADLALAVGDNDGANAYFKQFLDLDPNNAQLWIERGNAMLAAGKRDVALDSYAAAEKLLGSDPAKRVEVVALRGQALEGMGKPDEAIVEYQRAIKMAPKGYYLEVELTNRIVNIHRDKQTLPELLARYETQWPEGSRGHFEWSTLGMLYAETGAQDKAIAALKRAVAKAAWELATQRRLIQMLQTAGRDDEALAQYEAVVRAAPGEAQFQVELADLYQRRGQEKKALDMLSHLQARFPSDAGILSLIADRYQRWGKDELAIAQYERLAKLEPDDPSHLVTLGEQYWQNQDKPRALATWKRIANSGKPSGFAKLGEVLGKNGFPADALASYAKAIKLDDKNPEFYKGRADVYESQKNFADAVADWERVLQLVGTKPTDRMARREARRKLVAIVTRWSAKEQQYKKRWLDAFANGTGTDVEAGYFLMEYYGKQGRGERGQPEKILEQLRTKVPDDQELVLELVKAYRAGHKYPQAIALLLELARNVPSREREVFNQIADIKIDDHKDDEATEWRMKAIAKNPTNANAYQELAEGFVTMQRFPEAIAAYQKVLSLEPKHTKAPFALAQLYIQNDNSQREGAHKAAELFRSVLRTANDADVIERAAREAIEIEEITDSLGELEKVMAPLSFMMAHKPVYRRVLVDLYLRYVPRLVSRERHGNDEIKKLARTELARIGGHGLQPLLEALRDENTPQRREVVAALGDLGNKGAAVPLVHIAHQKQPDTKHIGTNAEAPDRDFRVAALVAAGRLGDPNILAELQPVSEYEEVAMREAAMFALGRSGDRRAVPQLLKALSDRRPTVQTLACLGLAQIEEPRVVPALAGALGDARKDDATRAACAYALGARRATAGIPALLVALADNRGETQRLAAWSLGQLGDAKTLGPLLRAYFARAGRSADELVWAIGRVGGAGVAPASSSGLDEFPGKNKYDHNAAVLALPGPLPKPPTPGKLLADHADDIAKGLLDALGEHRDVVVSVLSDLDGAPARISLGGLSGNTDAKTDATLVRIGEAIAAAVTAQLASDDSKVRALAISVLAKIDAGTMRGADAAIAKALDDTADYVRASAMNAVVVLARRRGAAPPDLVAALGKVLATGDWGDRRVAARALGQLGVAGDLASLVKAANDPQPFVRTEVAIAFGLTQTTGSLDVVLKLSRDDNREVRAAAALSLGSYKDPRAAQRRQELAGDGESVVRKAASE